MAELTDPQIDAALDRGAAARLHEPRAAAVRYDGRLRRVIVELTNGCTFAFPPELVQGLRAATEEQLSQVEILANRTDVVAFTDDLRFICKKYHREWVFGVAYLILMLLLAAL